ncbi:MAG: YutD family protein [Clostridium sp.]|nr:YutD family protein [Clostridium sp.]MCM1444748.1 YutD family protein [Candidatus Amulumruptor caecigallinarius]
MSKKYILNEKEYEIVENYKDGFSFNDLEDKFTDYFYDYDYILGDWAYGKLRLKGFYDDKNKKCNKLNDIKTLKDYIKTSCAYDCRYFVIRKVN